MTLFKCIIEVPKHAIKKNSKQIFQNKSTGQRFIGSNSKAQYLMNYLNAQLLKEKLKQRIETITCDVNCSFTFYFPQTIYYNKKHVRSKKIADLSNLYESPQDALQKVGILFDDSLICSHDGSSRKPITENKYYLKIEITKLNQD